MQRERQRLSHEELLAEAELEDSEIEDVTLVAPPTQEEYNYVYSLWERYVSFNLYDYLLI
jgi:hypothetical protein